MTGASSKIDVRMLNVVTRHFMLHNYKLYFTLFFLNHLAYVQYLNVLVINFLIIFL